MILDFAELADLPLTRTDIVVIGAGLAGLALAERLMHEGLRILVLESGDRTQDGDEDPLNRVEQAGVHYSGATSGRYRCIGGSTSRWGGALLPSLPYDRLPHPVDWHDGWPVTAEELNYYVPDAEKLFDLPAGSYEADALPQPAPPTLGDFVQRAPKWPPLNRRNIGLNLEQALSASGEIRVVVNACVTDLIFKDGAACGVVVQGLSGGRLEIHAKAVVLAAGAIETTRLLLVAQKSEPALLAELPIGNWFSDHVSAPVARLEPVAESALGYYFSFAFSQGAMRNWRYELAQAARTAGGLPGAFAHVAFTRDAGGGFAALREILQSGQKGVFPSPRAFAAIAADAPWFARAIYRRFVHARVLPPDDANFELHLVTEQEPNATSCVTLSETQKDRFGVPLARIAWSVSDSDFAFFHQVRRLFLDSWREASTARLAKVVEYAETDIDLSIEQGGGVYHPVGTTRMGKKPGTSVVDAKLAVHGVAGLWIASTSVLPTSGSTNPSMDLLLLTLRLADTLKRHFAYAG